MSKRFVTGAAVITAAGTALISSAAASATPSRHGEESAKGYSVQVILSGTSLTHDVNGSQQPLTKPDDIAFLDGRLFVGFQNGVGPMGDASSSDGNAASTLVEMNRHGHAIRQWDLNGKIDGLGADPASGLIAATVNEDGNSSLYTINPSGPSTDGVTHYDYNQDPLPHGGGTDAVTFMNGMMLVSASAPATPGAGPAVYSVTLQQPTAPGGSGFATITTLFSNDASATPADSTAPSQLNLSDPDSNIAVPSVAPRFGGDFMLDSQGDQQQVYVSDPGAATQALSVLQLNQSVNDTSFVTAEGGVLFVTDAANDSVDAVTGPFHAGDALVAVTPCGSNSAPATCPAPGFPNNYLGTLDLNTGGVSSLPISGASLTPEGMVFVGNGDDHQAGEQADQHADD